MEETHSAVKAEWKFFFFFFLVYDVFFFILLFIIFCFLLYFMCQIELWSLELPSGGDFLGLLLLTWSQSPPEF